MAADRARIHLLRHGEVDASWKGRVYGGLDVGLAPEGRARFHELALALRDHDFAAIYSSGLSRAVEGARAIAEGRDIPLRAEPRFAEIDRGQWAGRSLLEIERESPGAIDAYLADPDACRVHGGESHAELRARAFPALEELAQRHAGDEVLVVCHGQVMRVVVAAILEVSGPASLRLMHSHGGITTVDRYPDGEWVVQAMNAPALRMGAWGGRAFKP